MSRAVDKIKQKINILDVVGSYINLKKAGIHYKGLCPFHNEKTPSFLISPERNSYYCFGCGAKGDIFSFVEEYEGVDFKQALSILADRAGVDLSNETFSPTKKINKDLYSVLEKAEEYFCSNLKTETNALQYLKGRGLTIDTINDWKIGYSKDEWRGLYDFLLQNKISPKDMLSVGLIKKKDRGGNTEEYYDVFRGRIIFPIKDMFGRTVGFTGRILIANDELPKYLNTPETELFNKSEILYGLDKAKSQIRKQDYIIVVEGQMDVIMSHQANVKNTVASSGTAFTVEQLSKISPMTKRILFAFDSDNAGTTAMKRSGLLALKAGFDVKVLGLSGMKDTADMVKEDPNIWIEAIKQSKPIIDFFINTVLNTKTDERNRARLISSEVIPFISALSSNIEQAHYIKKISDLFGLQENAVWLELEKKSEEKEKSFETAEVKGPKIEKAIAGGSEVRKKVLFGALFLLEVNPSIFPKEIDIKSKLESILGTEDLNQKINEYEESKQELMFIAEDTLFSKDDYSHSESLIEQFLASLEVEYIDKELYKLKQSIKEAEQKGDLEETEKLLKEYNQRREEKQNILSGNKK